VLEKSPTTRDRSRLMILSQIAERGDTAGAIAWLDKIDNRDEAAISMPACAARLIARGGNLDAARKALTKSKRTIRRTRRRCSRPTPNCCATPATCKAPTRCWKTPQALPDNPDLLYDYALLAEKLGNSI
jgi:hypothetical protein